MNANLEKEGEEKQKEFIKAIIYNNQTVDYSGINIKQGKVPLFSVNNETYQKLIENEIDKETDNIFINISCKQIIFYLKSFKRKFIVND
jgi:hypothetical protein